MLKLQFNTLILCFLIAAFISFVNGTSLWDLVIKKEQVVLTVEYQNRYLNVWREDSHGYSRFYVTPLCVIDIDSISCSRDEYSTEHRDIFEINVKLWDRKAAETVKKGLQQKNICAEVSDILPLPMQMVRIGLGGKDLIPYVDNEWRSNQHQPQIMSFELYTRHEHFCDKMVHEVKNNTHRFLRNLKPYFEFTMVVGQHASRNINITGKTLQNSSFFAELMNKYADRNGIVYLQSKDLNRLSRGLINKAVFEEEVSTDYISTNQEHQIINELLDIFKEQHVQSNELTKEEWDSVFWDDIFSRPDIQTEYFNEVLKHDEGENVFKYNETKDKEFREDIYKRHHGHEEKNKSGGFGFSIFGFGEFENGSASFNASGSRSKITKNENENNHSIETKNVNSISSEKLQKHLRKDNVNVKWSGTKFTPKDLTLYRLNTKNLNLSNEVYFKRVVVSKHQETQKIEISAEPNPVNETENVLGNCTDGYWSSQDCFNPKPFVCEVSSGPTYPTSYNCSLGWTYFPLTGSCYGVDNGQNLITWSTAEKYCQSKGAQLPSIHSYEEDLFLRAFTFVFEQGVWLGLYSIDQTKTWLWSDGSQVDYVNWAWNDTKPQDVYVCLGNAGFYNQPSSYTCFVICKKSVV